LPVPDSTAGSRASNAEIRQGNPDHPVPNPAGQVVLFPLFPPAFDRKEPYVSKKKILIVEDEESLLRLESILLTSKGYNVRGAANGQEALEAIEQEQPDLVLLDIMLPGLDGFEVCRRIKHNPLTKDIPVIMVTAKKSGEDMARGEEVGADWYITKPFKSAMVIETIQRFLTI
jgi:twitching motility two-component system response regulator PilG